MAFTNEDLKRLKVRFYAKVNKTPTCWLWTASNYRGYGQIWNGERLVAAHRLSYEWAVGPIPPGLTIDHICHVHGCVNPAHLRIMTMLENVMDGCVNAKKDHCPKGHPYNLENTIRYRTFRYCRTCKRNKDRVYYGEYRDRILARKREAWRKACGK